MGQDDDGGVDGAELARALDEGRQRFLNAVCGVASEDAEARTALAQAGRTLVEIACSLDQVPVARDLYVSLRDLSLSGEQGDEVAEQRALAAVALSEGEGVADNEAELLSLCNEIGGLTECFPQSTVLPHCLGHLAMGAIGHMIDGQRWQDARETAQFYAAVLGRDGFAAYLRQIFPSDEAESQIRLISQLLAEIDTDPVER